MNEFIPLPSNPDDLTAEHALAAFGGDIDGALRELLRQTARNSSRDIQSTTPEATVAASVTGVPDYEPASARL